MIPIDDTDLPQLTQLAEALVAAPDNAIRSASLDPAEITVPGVWLRFTGLDYTLEGAPLQLQLVMVVGDTDGGIRVARELAKLHNAVAEVLGQLDAPDAEAPLYVNIAGLPTAATAVLSDTSTGLPALVVPITIA
jgi:hypothetical protein